VRVLVVEDDLVLAQKLQQCLSREGYVADVAADGIDGEHFGREEAYDGIILDLGLPGRSGLEVLKNWRTAGIDAPVIILTARDAWYQKVEGFKAGADDYMAKPFHVEELLARIQALLRRHAAREGGSTSAFGLKLDEERQTVTTAAGERLDLTGTEFRLLRYMMLHPGKVLSKTRLTEHIYAYDADRDSNVIEVYVTRLRHKLGRDLIRTRRGQGYVFGE
jgi:two-component system, OmpR family, response regulator